MKVCLIGSTLYPPTEGVATHVWGLAQFLSSKGHKVVIISRRVSNSNFVDNYEGILVLRPNFYPLYPFHIQIHRIFVSRAIKQLEPTIDLIHYHSPLPPPILSCIPIISTFHNFMKMDSKNRKVGSLNDLASKMQTNLSFLIERKLVEISKEITVASNRLFKEARKLFPTLQKQITTIHNGVDTDFFYPEKQTPSLTNNKYLLFVGRLDQQKGIIDLIIAMKSVLSAYPDLELKIAGQGPLRTKINELINKLDMRNNIKLLGVMSSANELRDLYRHAYALVCPSVYESGPRIVLECMSCGTPVIGTPVGIMPDVINDNENGMIVALKNPDMLADKILQLVSTPILRRRFIESCREPIVQGFSLETMGASYLQIYRNYCEE